MTLSPEELKAAIERTKEEIYRLKDQLERTNDFNEKRRLKLQLKELRYLQFRHLDQVG